MSNFGGSAWTFDPGTGQYYYHAYLREQPDLNWRNPEVQAAMLNVLHFWLDRGVDGFRIDGLRQIIKDDQWRDNPPNLEWRPEQGPYQTVSVTAERRDAKSLLALYRRLIAVRRRLPVLAVGDYRGLQGEGDLLAYLREHQGQRVAIVLNLGIESLRFELPGSGQVLLSTNLHREAEPVKRLLDLRPNEGLVVELD